MCFDELGRRIGIVGTRLIGASWAALYQAPGFEVTVADLLPAAEQTELKDE